MQSERKTARVRIFARRRQRRHLRHIARSDEDHLRLWRERPFEHILHLCLRAAVPVAVGPYKRAFPAPEPRPGGADGDPCHEQRRHLGAAVQFLQLHPRGDGDHAALYLSHRRRFLPGRFLRGAPALAEHPLPHPGGRGDRMHQRVQPQERRQPARHPPGALFGLHLGFLYGLSRTVRFGSSAAGSAQHLYRGGEHPVFRGHVRPSSGRHRGLYPAGHMAPGGVQRAPAQGGGQRHVPCGHQEHQRAEREHHIHL